LKSPTVRYKECSRLACDTASSLSYQRHSNAHGHDHYEETIYGSNGVLTWTVDGKKIDVGPGQALCVPAF